MFCTRDSTFIRGAHVNISFQPTFVPTLVVLRHDNNLLFVCTRVCAASKCCRLANMQALTDHLASGGSVSTLHASATCDLLLDRFDERLNELKLSANYIMETAQPGQFLDGVAKTHQPCFQLLDKMCKGAESYAGAMVADKVEQHRIYADICDKLRLLCEDVSSAGVVERIADKVAQVSDLTARFADPGLQWTELICIQAQLSDLGVQLSDLQRETSAIEVQSSALVAQARDMAPRGAGVTLSHACV